MTRRDEPTDALAPRYAAALLHALESPVPVAAIDAPAEHPALSWARSGLMALTGAADGAPLMCPLPLTACADGALAALAHLAPPCALAGLRGTDLLAERAAIAGHVRRGTVSPGGSCRLIATRDGQIALNLARDDDRALLPAWLESDSVADDVALDAVVRRQTMHDLVERGRLLGLAVAPLVPPPTWPLPWFAVTHAVARPERTLRVHAPRVLDLASLWAGPLCGQLLQRCGADVVKVESLQRPDGARRGPPAFFDVLNAGKRSVALDLSAAAGRAQLRALIAQADIVIEASRPRALRQMGINAEALIDEHPGLSWISLSGYGRGEPQENWIAYGDDAGVAAGLSYLMREAIGAAVIVGDAIADPLTGLHAALAAWVVHQQGGGRLLALSLTDVVRHCIQFDRPATAEALRQRQQDWTQRAQRHLCPPAAQAATRAAAALGADTAAVFAEWGVAC
jgi:crotonobetainyl-CoA:carnitine CoA-transferase CaiB-like acyl-CoA transferase